MRAWIRCDCAGDPPGELISSATARAPLTAKARSSVRAIDDIMRPGLSGVATPMVPDRRTTGTIGTSGRSGGGIRRRAKSAKDIEAGSRKELGGTYTNPQIG